MIRCTEVDSFLKYLVIMIEQIRHFLNEIFFMYNWSYSILIICLIVFSVIFIIIKTFISNNIITSILIYGSLVVYVGLILFATIIDRETTTQNGYCLIPFYTYYQFYNGNNDIVQQALMNIALFYPLGYLMSCTNLSILHKQKWTVVLIAFLFSLGIEIIQFLFHLGYAEVDDVIHNTFGSALGMGGYYLLQKISHDVKSKCS